MESPARMAEIHFSFRSGIGMVMSIGFCILLALVFLKQMCLPC